MMKFQHALRGLRHGVVLLILLAMGGGLTACENGKVNLFSLEDDMELGRNLSLQIAGDQQNFPLAPREGEWLPVYERLEMIRDRILATGQLKYGDRFAWEVHVIDDPSTLNAFCAPGGYIYFYTGLLKFLDNEAQVAGVMGHEMAHADRRHSTTQFTKERGLEFLLHLLKEGAGARLKGLAKELAGLAIDGAGRAAILTFSRSDESEADRYAVNYLYATSYHAREVAGFFEKLAQQGASATQPPAFLSTHPPHENRIADIENEWMRLGGKSGKTYMREYQEFRSIIP